MKKGAMVRDGSKLFYGWYIVIAASILATYNSGTFIYGFSAFITPIAATTGWSYAQITLATSLRGLEIGALEPFLGMAVDRWPARGLMFIGIALTGFGVFCISQAINLVIFYIGFLIAGFGSSLAVQMVPTVTITRWFRRNIGKANGIFAMGRGIGGWLVPILVLLIKTYGWQQSLLFLSIGTWAVGLPLSLIFRTRPEEHGLFPDGKPPDDTIIPTSVTGHHRNYDFSVDVKQAVKTRAFWYIGIAFMLQMGLVGAILTHVMPYFESLGIDRAAAGWFFMLIPIVSVPARLPYGWLADIFSRKFVLAWSFAITTSGIFLLCILNGNSFALMITFVVVFGLGIAGHPVLRPPLLREYFGTKKIGTVLGINALFTTIGIVIGTPLAGWMYDTYGHYQPIWLIYFFLSIVGIILIFILPATHQTAVGTGESNKAE